MNYHKYFSHGAPGAEIGRPRATRVREEIVNARNLRQRPLQKLPTVGHHRSDWRPVTTGLAPRPPNLLVVGASGHVAQAFLLRLQSWRHKLGRLVLLDPGERVLQDRFLDHRKLDYRFIQGRLRLPEEINNYHQLLRAHEIDIVLDLTDQDTIPFLAATDAAGVSYVNTALNDARRGVGDVLDSVHPSREDQRKAPHIISSGMNPGVVNIWVWNAVRAYGPPTEITHFEYDTSMPVTGWRPMITWSRQEFLAESVWERTGLVVDGEIKLLPGNSFEHREDLRSVMEPIIELSSYPRGLLVLHEENVKLGGKLGASSKYLYAVHPTTMEYLEQLWRERGRVDIDDLEIGDNTSVPLQGADTIGVCLEYPDRRIYYLHSLDNSDVVGTNATCAQVAVGVEAALETLLSEPLPPRIYFASDLYDTVYRDVVLKKLRVEHFAWEKPKAQRGEPRPQTAPSTKFECIPDLVLD